MAGDRVATTRTESNAPHPETNEQASGWFVDNVLHPFINGTGVRQVADTFTGTKYTQLYEEQSKSVLDSSVQTVSSLAGTIAPYVVLGKLTHNGFGSFAEKQELTGFARTILKSESVANVTAAGAYEFLKKPGDGQTRVANTAGTMLSFSAFELGGHVLGKLSPLAETKLANFALIGSGRAVIGAVGGEVGYESTNFVAGHTGGENQANNAGRLNAALFGAVLNEALPVVHMGATRLIGRPAGALAGSAETAQSDVTQDRVKLKTSAVEQPAAITVDKVDGSPGLREKTSKAMEGLSLTVERWNNFAVKLLRGSNSQDGFAFNSNDGAPDVATAVGAKVASDVAIAARTPALPGIEITDNQATRLSDAPAADPVDAHYGIPKVGLTFTPDGVNFGLRSPRATSVELLTYSSPDAKEPDGVFSLNRTGDIWHRINQIPEGTAYQYRVHGPEDSLVEGSHFDGTKKLLDPEALAVHWADSGDGKKLDPRGIVKSTKFDWQGVEKPNIPPEKRIIYELNVKAFAGGYEEMASPEKIAHLKSLGVTHIEVMPVQEFFKDVKINPENGKLLENAWGYNGVAFKAPEGSYSEKGSTGEQIASFQRMVLAYHRAGMGVIIDFVPNHTGEGPADGPTFNFKGINGEEVYMHEPVVQPTDGSAPDPAKMMDFSGCGNTVSLNTPYGLEYMISSARHFATELQVDGFRVDLAPVLKRGPDGKFIENGPFMQAVAADPVLSKSIWIAEPWDIKGWGPGRFGEGWGEWNGHFRDTARRFIKGDAGQVKQLGDMIAGSPNAGFDPDKNIVSVNFVTAHDGQTLNDVVTYEGKYNWGNGEQNRDGNDSNDSRNYGVEGPVEKGSPIDVLRERQIKNFMSLRSFSLGTEMMLYGDEVRRTANGNNNAYNQPEVNKFDWKLVDENPGVLNFQRGVNAIRSDLNIGYMRPTDIIWHGVEPEKPDWSDNARFIATQYKAVGDANKTLYFAANAWEGPIDITLPPGTWHRIVDTNLPEFQDVKPVAQGDLMDSSQYRVMPYTTVMFVQDVPAGTSRPINAKP